MADETGSPTPQTPTDFGARPAPRPPNLPAEIGGYRIQRVIGSGGMATVYAAMQSQPRRVVALKVMKAGLSHGPRGQAEVALRRFKREIEILGKLRHPYIAQIYGAGMHDDGSGATPYFVMEYVEGAKTITEFIAAHDLNLRERLKLFVKVCAAVEHGHRRKVVHRDLKPANILIDEAGDPKIIDFGVAQATELDLSSQTMHTEAGRLVGTLQYMSPEQLSGRPQDLDARCDVYALGVLLYKITTGKPPRDLQGLPVYEAVRIIREETPRRPSEMNPEVRGDLETIILKAMEPQIERRYPNAGSLGRDIVRYLANKPIHARRAGAFYRAGLFVRRHRVAITSGGIVAVIMSIALAIVALRSGQTPSPTPSPSPPLASSTTSDAAPDESTSSHAHDTAESAGASHASPQVPAAVPPLLSKTNEPRTLSAHTGSITDLAVSADGTHMASASFDRLVLLWDLTVDPPKRATVHIEAPIQHLSFTTDGSILAAVDAHGPVYLIDVPAAIEAGELRASSVYAMPDIFHVPVSSLAIDSTGDRVAVGLDDLTVHVRPTRADSPAKPLVLRSAAGAITSIAISEDQRWIAGGSQGGTVYLWNADDGSVIYRFTDLHKPIVEVGFATVWRRIDEHTIETIPRLLAVASDGSAATWAVAANDDVAPVLFPAFPDDVVAASLEPGGRWLICAGRQEARIWNVQRRIEPRQVTYVSSSEIIYAIAVNPEVQACAMGYANGEIRMTPVAME